LKKIVSILLLFCLILNIVGYHVIFYFRQAEIKAEMKKSLLIRAHSEDETGFSFSLNDKKAISTLDWVGDNEFKLNGQMYDVIEKKIENGKLILRCISDIKETALIKTFYQMNNESNSKRKLALLMQLVNNSYLANTNSEIVIRYKPVPPIIHPESDPLTSQVRDVLTPPPQVS
jgi:hypothetical protein